MSRLGLDGQAKAKWASSMKEKLRWPFLQPKLQLLRSDLDKLKATLLLMLNVMTYARQLSERYGLSAACLCIQVSASYTTTLLTI